MSGQDQAPNAGGDLHYGQCLTLYNCAVNRAPAGESGVWQVVGSIRARRRVWHGQQLVREDAGTKRALAFSGNCRHRWWQGQKPEVTDRHSSERVCRPGRGLHLCPQATGSP